MTGPVTDEQAEGVWVELTPEQQELLHRMAAQEDGFVPRTADFPILFELEQLGLVTLPEPDAGAN